MHASGLPAGSRDGFDIEFLRLWGYILDMPMSSGGTRMKKILIAALVLFALVPAATFADLQIGALALYKGDVSTLSVSGLGLNDFTFGLDARLNLGILQGSVAALYYPADTTAAAPIPASLLALTDVGLCIDILFIRIGAGIGPNFSVPLENVAASPWGSWATTT
jgi:hypothetical protein